MLHKSFKPAKCKTSLKLATSRIKLMKNKKGAQMNQMKRELAQLLETGQDRTARIRVEHLIREEKMVAAYELIEIYCELIAARLPIIESQKNCPIDLKEAIASVIFASPRCADIPELIDVKKHFTAKYGKEFVTTTLELRPNSGVARMLVEKLSAIAPNVQTKVKVLKAIAEEHNIKWDSESFEEKESKPTEDLLNGPSTFEKSGEMHVDDSKIHVPNVQAASGYDKPVKPSDFSESNSRSMLNTQKYSSTGPDGLNTTTASHADLRSSGSWAARMENRRSFGRNDNYSGRENWDIEFKDATSAARAAAESAERASMAARAAAELSSRADITGQYSAESQNSTKHTTSHGNYAASILPDEQFANAPGNNSFHDRTSLHNEKVGDGKYFNRYVQDDAKRHIQSASQSYRKDSITDDTFANSLQKPDGYSEKISFKETTRTEKDLLSPKTNLNKQSMEAGFRNATGWQDDSDTENFDQFGEAMTGRQHDISSSLTHSSPGNENYKVKNHNNRKSGVDISEDHYVENHQESIHEDITKMGSYDDYSAAFAEYESNNRSNRVDAAPKYDEESTSYIPSLGNNSAAYFPATTDTWNSIRDASESRGTLTSKSHFSAENHSSPRFSENLAKSENPSESDTMPVMHDVPKFDSKDQSDNSTHGGRNDSMHFSHKQNVFYQDPEPESQSQTYGSTGDKVLQKAQKATAKSSFRPPVARYIDHHDDNLKEDIAKQFIPNGAHLDSGASSKTNNERKTNSSNYIASTSTKPKFQANRNSAHAGSNEQPGATKQATSEAMPVSKTTQQYKNYYSSAAGQPSSPFRDPQAKSNIGSVKATTVKAEPPTREDSTKRASHVHPKLPDYDSIAAHMQSLRADRR